MKKLASHSNDVAWAAFGSASICFVLLIGGLIFYVPVYAEMFADFGAELPKPTLIVVNIGFWLKSNFLLVAPLIGAALFGAYKLADEKDGQEGDSAILWCCALFFVLLGALVYGAMHLPIIQVTEVIGK